MAQGDEEIASDPEGGCLVTKRSPAERALCS